MTPVITRQETICFASLEEAARSLDLLSGTFITAAEAAEALRKPLSAIKDARPKIYVLFHAKGLKQDGKHNWCTDGLFAAYAAWLAHRKSDEKGLIDLRMTPAMYGQPPELELSPRDYVYLLDLTYPAPVLEAWADKGAIVQVIDHHKQALEDLSGLSDRVLQQFDMQRSGATLTWRFFHGEENMPDLFRYVQDRDIWTKALPDCDLVAFGLTESLDGLTLKEALEFIDSVLRAEFRGDENPVRLFKSVGEGVKGEIDRAIQTAVSRRSKRLVLGQQVIFTLCLSKREKQAYSDIGHACLKANPECAFAVVQSGNGWALRSNESHADVAVLAKQLGGGGHRNASGCAAELPFWLMRLIYRLWPKCS